MKNETTMVDKTRNAVYWITTTLVCMGMFGGGVAQLIGAKWNADGMIHLGFPLYAMKIIGTWKILGVFILLTPGFLLLKEWAYAGFFFLMTGAVVSHLTSGDGIGGSFVQGVFVILIILSWYLRPAERKLRIS